MSTLRARITLAMATLVALLAVASALALSELSSLEQLSDDVARIDEATRRLQRVATAMRDAYAHEAHVVILDDLTHLDHYRETHLAARRAVEDARRALPDAEDLADLALIERAIVELDASFQRDLLPSIPGRAPNAARAHEQAVQLVESAQITADRLTRRLDDRAAGIRVLVAASRDRLFARCVLLFVAAVGLAFIVAVLLDRQVSAPVRALADAAHKLGTGELQTRVAVHGDDELAALARNFNAMAAELEARQRALLEAERLAGVGRLAAGVAHEINNPLGVMLGYLRLIEKRAGDNAALRDDAAMVRAEIHRCQQIVAGLLDLSRPPRLALAEVDVAAVVREAAAPLPTLADGAPRARVTAPGPVLAVVDEGKVLQIVRNLMANAVEAAPDAAFDVAVDLDVDAGQRGRGGPPLVQVSVTDRGPGLSPEARARLFEPFFTSKPKGTGLGLAISRAFAEAHGGSLSVGDEPGGASFVVRLPCAPPGARP